MASGEYKYSVGELQQIARDYRELRESSLYAGQFLPVKKKNQTNVPRIKSHIRVRPLVDDSIIDFDMAFKALPWRMQKAVEADIEDIPDSEMLRSGFYDIENLKLKAYRRMKNWLNRGE